MSSGTAYLPALDFKLVATCVHGTFSVAKNRLASWRKVKDIFIFFCKCILEPADVQTQWSTRSRKRPAAASYEVFDCASGV
eukprot:s8327_g3.t1